MNLQKQNITYKKIFLICFIIILSIHYINALNNRKKLLSMQKDIATKILRFHVVANSDSPNDQKLKLLVKDTVINYIHSITNSCTTLDETLDCINKHISHITILSKNVLLSNNCNYDVTAHIDYCLFPVKTYGDLTLPSGTYRALNINIGKSLGKNWWCILFPNLCYVDGTCTILSDSSKNKFKNILTPEEYALIFNDPKKYDISFEFKIVNLLKNYFN